MEKMKISFVLFFVLIFMFTLQGCRNSNDEISSSTNAADSYYVSYNPDDLYFDGEGYVPFTPDPNRSVWNIDVEFYKIDKLDSIQGAELAYFNVTDHDNLGFEMNDYDYKLEKLDGNKWITITDYPTGGDVRSDMFWSVYNNSWSYVIPTTERDYITTRFIIYVDPDFKNQKGTYRFTQKVQGDHELSCEFVIE